LLLYYTKLVVADCANVFFKKKEGSIMYRVIENCATAEQQKIEEAKKMVIEKAKKETLSEQLIIDLINCYKVHKQVGQLPIDFQDAKKENLGLIVKQLLDIGYYGTAIEIVTRNNLEIRISEDKIIRAAYYYAQKGRSDSIYSLVHNFHLSLGINKELYKLAKNQESGDLSEILSRIRSPRYLCLSRS